MKKRDHSKTAGFTLIELLVVIAILAILVAVGIPVYTGYISRANDAAVTTELGAVLTAAEAANAIGSGKITSIQISPYGEVTVNLDKEELRPKSFYQDFAAFYGVDENERPNSNLPFTIKSLQTLLSQSDTYKQGAIWENNTWSAPGVN
ncbi:MAG: prepilin-type N-terminal cleavage/methylation domain-containing protein [Oscillospiraceae bacterium]|nr:prepilin-type N-terminal cleavage/methylation domain-containing protein [Oscillospiraceae bacterium]